MKTLGEFYREKVLSCDDLITVEWPYRSDSIQIRQDLFGWKLYAGKNFIECSSEAEARYLKVFFEAGMRSVCIPKDEEYLESILPELESIKARIDEVINFYLESVLDRKVKEEVKREVFIELTK